VTAAAERPDPMAFGRGLARGVGLNLLVRDVARAADFAVRVLGARCVYREEHFAVMEAVGSTWLLHSDWSYRNHPLRGAVPEDGARGGGIEIRLYGVDPDRAESAARGCDAVVLAGATDKEHGLREAYLVDDDGYVWVPSVPLPCA